VTILDVNALEKPGDVLDFSDVYGQENVKQALEVAVAASNSIYFGFV
jgi:predicted ATPase with chaperone activity